MSEQLVREHYEAMNERAVRRARIATLSRAATAQARLEAEKGEGR